MTAEPDFTIRPILPGDPAIPTVADWRHRAWFAAEGFTPEQSVAQLQDMAARCAGQPQGFETALICAIGKEPVGTVLLIEREYEQLHDVSPWLAGLYVVPGRRGNGIGRRLVSAVEERAGRWGFGRIYLYTADADAFYARLGWQVQDDFDWDGDRFCLMVRDLAT